METACLPLDVIVHTVIQPWVYLPYQFEGIGVFALCILCGFSRMASGAILWRDNDTDRGFVMFEVLLAYISVCRAGNMAIQTGNICMGMPAGRPVGYNPLVFFGVTVDALLCVFGNAPDDAIFLQRW
jgi:hypothetical protein